MAWFSFLKAEGYFDPEKNPEPIQVKDGFQIPYWDALSYLEKLSVQIREGKELELVDELLSVIKNVSEHPKDNYRTWYVFIKILANIPNEKITIDILNFIPVWFSGRFDTMLQTSELCEKLLPKFLNGQPTKEDVQKAELILHFLFQVEKKQIIEEDTWNIHASSYYSKIYLHFLSRTFERNSLAPKIIEYCSDNFLLELGRTIKFLLLDYPKGINAEVIDNKRGYQIKILIDKENLIVTSKSKDNKIVNAGLIIKDFEVKNETDLKQELVSILKNQNINYIPTNNNEDIFQRLNFAINNDLSSAFGFNSIRKLGDRYLNDDKLLDVFSLIFRDLNNEKTKFNPDEAILLLKVFCYDKKYSIPFYKRIALYTISENWNATKSLFWDLIKENDALNIFSTHKYQKELFELLDKNQQLFTYSEKEQLQKIIEIGAQNEKDEKEERRQDYWKLRWYSALKNTEPFNEKYLELSKSLNITSEHFENLGEVRIRSGNVPPISKDELLNKSNQEIAEYIRSFQPKSRWDEPNMSGLSDVLGSAVEEQPDKFADEIELYQDISYIYSYRMLNAFRDAWQKKKYFNWEKVLQFCLQTLKSNTFYSGELKSENDDWGATADWVVGAIALLLTEGMTNDNNAFDINLFPLAKEIIQILISNLQGVENFEETKMDYPTYSLNSTAGKSLRALFDYSLRRARNFFKYEDEGKWEPDVKLLFEQTLSNGILDGYILEGMYFEQFYFLDKGWITKQVIQHYNLEERKWFAFMSGITFGNPPFSKDIYTLFYPHYQRAINDHIEAVPFINGLVKHLTAFYFWGYETLDLQKLLFLFLDKAFIVEIQELVNFIWRQEAYQKSLSEIEQYNFQKLILELWIYLTNKYENSKTEEEDKLLASLSNWILFAPELNEIYTKLILKSCKHIDKIYSTHILLENLITLKNKGNPNMAAKAVGEIMLSLNFKDIIGDFDKDYIKDLVLFLFLHGQKKIASDFCNKLASEHQQFFLREIYEANVADKFPN